MPFSGILAALFAALCLAASLPADAAPRKIPPLAYPYSDQGEFWVNSEPLADRDLRGKPVMVFFWTFGCYNCANTMPWVASMQERYADRGLLVLGVHTPEFAHERDRCRVKAKADEWGLDFPTTLDNDYIYWRAMQNSWWPAFYIYDGLGNLRGSYIGETHLGTAKAAEIEGIVEALLSDS